MIYLYVPTYIYLFTYCTFTPILIIPSHQPPYHLTTTLFIFPRVTPLLIITILLKKNTGQNYGSLHPTLLTEISFSKFAKPNLAQSSISIPIFISQFHNQILILPFIRTFSYPDCSTKLSLKVWSFPSYLRCTSVSPQKLYQLLIVPLTTYIYIFFSQLSNLFLPTKWSCRYHHTSVTSTSITLDLNNINHTIPITITTITITTIF